MPLHSPYYFLIPLILGGGASFVGFLGGWYRWPVWLTGTISGILASLTIAAILALASLTVCVTETC